MPYKVAVLAPFSGKKDPLRLNDNFVIRYGPQQQELTLRALSFLGASGFDTAGITQSQHLYNGIIPSAGYYLTGLLRSRGYDVQLLESDDELCLQEAAKDPPRYFCISSTMLLTRDSLRDITARVRKYFPDTVIIVGGMQVWKSYCFAKANQDFMGAGQAHTQWSVFPCKKSDIDVDVFVVSPYGGKRLLEILGELDRGRKADLASTGNLAIPKDDGEFYFTERTTDEPDDEEDIIRWDHLDHLPIRLPLRTSMGCPYRCAYCDFHCAFPKLRLRSRQSLLKELTLIRNVCSARGVRCVLDLTDDNVFLTKGRIEEVCSALEESQIGAYWLGFFRTTHVNESNVEAIRRSRLLMARVGVESGDENQLRRMNKKQKPEQVRRAVELLDRCGVPVLMTCLVGFPGENDATLMNTARYLNSFEVESSSYQLFPLQILPMSKLGAKPVREMYAIQGMWNSWAHYTMSSHKVMDACESIFSAVSNIRYHYQDESVLSNRRYETEQRRELYRLRKELTLQLLAARPVQELAATLQQLTRRMGFDNCTPDAGFVRLLAVGGASTAAEA